MLSQILIREILHSTPSKYMLSSTSYFFSFNRSKTKVAAHLVPEQLLKPTKKSSSAAALRIKTINKAMKAYLERSKHYEDFLKVKNDEFEIGKQHLANMMGLDAATLTQEDVDRAIEYLLPSGLYEKKARPLMKPPKQLFPKEKAAQFDNNGRPYSSFFYTRKSNFHSALHVLVGKFHELDAFEDRMIAKGILAPPEESIFKLGGGEWITHEELNSVLLENLHEIDYEFLKTTLTRLSEHPYSFRCKDEIMKYRKEFVDLESLETIPELMHDADGRPYMEAEGTRKTSKAKVIVRGNGTGKIKINGSDIFHFPRWNDREQIMFPLEFTELLGLVDVEADVSGVGQTAQSGAIRYALALALRSFVDPNLVEKMRIAGLLTRDKRYRGRKIYGQKGHKAKYTWKKR